MTKNKKRVVFLASLFTTLVLPGLFELLGSSSYPHYGFPFTWLTLHANGGFSFLWLSFIGNLIFYSFLFSLFFKKRKANKDHR